MLGIWDDHDYGLNDGGRVSDVVCCVFSDSPEVNGYLLSWESLQTNRRMKIEVVKWCASLSEECSIPM